MDILSDSACFEIWNFLQFPGRAGNQICVHDKLGDGGRSDVCNGDSGGPLAVQVEDRC